MRLLLKLLVLAALVSPFAHATKYPSVPLQIRGRVIDSSTRKPIAGVQVLVFVNGSPIASNNGWSATHDYPNLPRSDSSGRFVGRAQLLRGAEKPVVEYLEVIALRDGYRTERFRRNRPTFRISKDSTGGVVEINDIELFKTKHE